MNDNNSLSSSGKTVTNKDEEANKLEEEIDGMPNWVIANKTKKIEEEEKYGMIDCVITDKTKKIEDGKDGMTNDKMCNY